jgi:hypothetical protein
MSNLDILGCIVVILIVAKKWYDTVVAIIDKNEQITKVIDAPRSGDHRLPDYAGVGQRRQ